MILTQLTCQQLFSAAFASLVEDGLSSSKFSLSMRVLRNFYMSEISLTHLAHAPCVDSPRVHPDTPPWIVQ